MPRPQPLRDVVARDPRLASWQARARREAACLGAIRRHLPRQLGQRVRAVVDTGTGIELVVAAGAIAAALRQRLPELRAALSREGMHADTLTVRVAIGAPLPATRPEAHPPLDRAALRPLAGLAATLPEGPLQRALARLLRRTG